jgi:hypothetical protein
MVRSESDLKSDPLLPRAGRMPTPQRAGRPRYVPRWKLPRIVIGSWTTMKGLERVARG